MHWPTTHPSTHHHPFRSIRSLSAFTLALTVAVEPDSTPHVALSLPPRTRPPPTSCLDSCNRSRRSRRRPPRSNSRPAMATPAAEQPATAAQSAPQQTSSGSRPASGHGAALSTSPVEMKTLPASASAPEPPSTSTAQTSESAPNATSLDTSTPQDSAIPAPSESVQPVVASSTSKPAPPADLNRSETEAIGPSTDTPAANPDNSNGPVVVIMLLLTTGARHPYKIDEKYLKKRNVTVEEMDPYNISVYTLKELIWRDWRDGTLYFLCSFICSIRLLHSCKSRNHRKTT